ncbi:DUF4892 domain-containing protein [Marinobacterium mangrovicola]|uniref:Uncharacterized protein DUF4892 n=1 Tax=Marinobacterium mangrovicola TaxID=1476959 RepID=A0A4R1GM73_9GAMM|nr:DUF4892 domain-containing protein [Marinobacterium mangrovicola]TCK09458.1 uncharacterized protein DUF4892 [Marinobacterium mangrovicola]
MRLGTLGYGLAALLSCLSLPAVAESPDWLEPVARSSVVQDRAMPAPDYRVMLGRVLKINGLIRTDRELKLAGSLQRTTWQLPSGETPETGFRSLRDQLQRNGADILFECEGRQCGASNIWANDLFETARLYGVDETQRYLAARRGSDYLVVYAVRRGNGRVFLNLDWVQDESGDSSGWVTTLEQQGYADLPGWPDAPDRAIQNLVSVLTERPGLNLVLVLHQEGRDIELSLRQSRELASRLKDQVVAEGIDSRRIQAYGAGALAPEVLGGRKQLAVVIQVPAL